MNLKNLFNISFERLRDGTFLNYTERRSGTSFGGSDCLELALNNPVLTTLINIRGNALGQFDFFHVDEKGERKDSFFDELISNPNPFQSKEDFLKEMEWRLICDGWVFQKPYGATGYDPTAIYNLSAANITFNKDLDRSLIFTKEDIELFKETSFTYRDLNTDTGMTIGDIIPFYDVASGLKGNPIKSPSRLTSIIKSITNIGSSLDAQNILLGQIGREMVYKERMNNEYANAVRTSDDDKKDMRYKWSLRSRGNKDRTVIADKEFGWKALHTSPKDVGFEEIVSINANLIGQALEVSNSVYKAYMQGDTFQNQNTGLLAFYQNTMQVRADNIAKSWSDKFGIKIKASCAHLPVMQESENLKIDSLLKVTQAIRNLQQAGFTTDEANEYLVDNGLRNIRNNE